MKYKLGWFSLVLGLFWWIMALVFVGRMPMGAAIIRIVTVIFYIVGVLFFFLGVIYLGIKYDVYQTRSKKLKEEQVGDNNKIQVK